MTEGFARTECACAECAACCTRQPGPLGAGDLERIAGFLRLPDEDVRALFVASRGSLVLERATGRTRWIGSITPARKPDGSCVFFDGGRCMIHPVAPFGCAFFDTHMDVATYAPRGALLARMMDTPAYQAVRRLLKGGSNGS